MEEKMIHDRYQLGDVIGRGGMGTIFLAHDMLLDRDVAVKVLSHPSFGTKGRARLLREAQQVAALNHPNIVTIFDAGESEGMPFIVMELVQGKSLHDQPPAEISQAINICQQICSALDHAHQHGIIHRDLKPENVILTGDGLVKLMDFGLARSIASRYSTETGITGTVFYLPPEQALGQPVDGRSDLYSLGVMLYEMVTGQLPFNGDDPLAVISQHLYSPVVPPRARNPQVSPELNNLILSLMGKSPQDRPASAIVVLQNLEQMAKPKTALQADETDLLTLIPRGRIVGREKELAEARQLWAKASMGEAQILLVSGEPGIGKTRLARELITLAEVMGGVTLTGECYGEGSAPYDPFAQMFRKVLNDGSVNSIKLPDFVLADLIALAPDLQIRYPGVIPNSHLDPQSEQQRLFENVIYLFLSLGAQAPLMLVFEDIHWADQATLSLLLQFARRVRQQQLMIIATYREVELDEELPLQDFLLALSHEHLSVRLKLTRLDRKATEAMLEALLTEKVPLGFLDSIYQETEGNPFYIEEVCKTLMESGSLIYKDGHWQYPANDHLQIPQSVRVTIQSRINRLPTHEQEILRLAAIFGREFDFDALLRASQVGDDDLIDLLERAVRAQLIEETGSQRGGAFRFVHALIPSTLVEGISGLRRRRMHRRAAEVLEQLRPQDLENLAYQYSQAEIPEQALHYLVATAERARARYANQDAIRYYSAALEYTEANPQARFQVLAAREQAYHLVAQRDLQYSDLQAMQILAEQIGDPSFQFDTWISLADYYLATNFRLAEKPTQNAFELAQKTGEQARQAQALYRLAWVAWHTTDFRRGADRLAFALKLLKQAGVQAGQIACLHLLALNLAYLGEFNEAQSAAEEAIQLSRLSKDRRQEATSIRRLAIVLNLQGKVEGAVQLYQTALVMHREVGDRAEECHALNALGESLARQGKLEEARQYFETGLELADTIGMNIAVELICSNMLISYYRPQYDFEGSFQFIEKRLSKIRQSGEQRSMTNLLRYQAELLLYFGQYTQALEITQQLVGVIEQQPDERRQIETRAFLGRCYAQEGDFGRAEQLIQDSLERVNQSDDPESFAEPQFHAAYVSWLKGDPNGWQRGLTLADVVVSFGRKRRSQESLAYALDMKARLLNLLDRPEQALECSCEAIKNLESSVLGMGKEQFYFTNYQILCSLEQWSDAMGMLEKAYQEVMRVAENLHAEQLQASWLENVPYNRQILIEYRNNVDKLDINN